MARVLVIDSYDRFVYNLVQYLGELGADPIVHRNDRITVDEALALLAKPRQRRGAKPPLKELGKDPATGKEIVVKDGRFGLYMTDGETNVSFRKAETLDNITLEHAAERLAEKRASKR